jgi:hypothetical protein
MVSFFSQQNNFLIRVWHVTGQLVLQTHNLRSQVLFCIFGFYFAYVIHSLSFLFLFQLILRARVGLSVVHFEHFIYLHLMLNFFSFQNSIFA